MPNFDNHKFLSDIPTKRSALIELFLIAVAIAFGINLLSAVLEEAMSSTVQVITGLLLLLLAVIYVLILRFGKRKFSQKFTAVLITDGNKDKKIIDIPDYRFSYHFKQVMESLFIENTAFKDQWISESLRHEPLEGEDKIAVRSKTSSQKLLLEVVEYIYLERLSMHLTDYFDNEGFNKESLVELSREDMSDIITTNRVLDIISRDIKDRPAFKKYANQDKSDTSKKGEVVYVWSDGALYTRFDMTLPKGTKIHRELDESITIENKNIKLNFKPEFNGYSYPVDLSFMRNYVKVLKPLEVDHWKIDLCTQVTVKPQLFAYSKRLKYHQWAESLLGAMGKEFHFKQFMEKTNWATVKTLLRATKTQIKAKEKTSKAKQQVSVSIRRTD